MSCSLHLVDASIIPEIPPAPTNSTTVMLAERIAANITAQACDESGIGREARKPKD